MTRTRGHIKPVRRPLKDNSTARISVRDQDGSMPGVAIKGDLRISVTEQEITHGPITGNYSLETESMHGPLFVLWRAEGAVMMCTGKSTSIVFDLSRAQAGQLWTAVVTVQLTELNGSGRTVVSGTLVQIFVTSDPVPEQAM